MAKKKKSQQIEQQQGTGANSAGSATSAAATTLPPSVPSSKVNKPTEPSTSALIICRNKHWRYISSFHGPWLQLPPEVLESLAHSNYFSPRPHPIDPAVFYDLVKIRKAVDEATSLAVRAASGLTSSALSNSLNAGNGMLGGAAALGLGYGGTGSNSKMSRERKHRMRELATQKLSQAYRLDEIAASVAMMQSTSTLEEVAQFVLQRNAADVDAKYVHFFHEKIPSRMMAQCTPLDALNDIIAERPTDGSLWRTRAVTRMFKEDHAGAARDLTEALAQARYWQAQHKAGKDQLVLAKTFKEQYGRDWRQEAKVEEEDQPNSLETQVLFHRAGVYFTIACQHIHDALEGQKVSHEARKGSHKAENGDNPGLESSEPYEMSPAEKEAQRRRLEARKIVKANAKRALRDYNAFLSHFDYTPGLPQEVAEEFLRIVNGKANGFKKGEENSPPRKDAYGRLLMEGDGFDYTSNSTALVSHNRLRSLSELPGERQNWPQLPPLKLFQVSELFSSAPPSSLPSYPPANSTNPAYPSSPALAFASVFADSHEAITYHPLLTDALHSLLLCHALIQTPPKELLRHAHNAARLARVCDGYPIFLAARSPARADWIEVIRRTGNWIGLTESWESLCRPAPLLGHGGAANGSYAAEAAGGAGPAARRETEEQRRERQKQEAILEALADERVVDEDSFQRAVRARERRAREDEEMERRAGANGDGRKGSAASAGEGSPTQQPKRWAQVDSKEYPISTDRAEAIARWVTEAPVVVEGSGKTKKKAKGKGKAKKDGLEESVSALSLHESDGPGEEEVD